jgi:iron(III) transport system permease protein
MSPWRIITIVVMLGAVLPVGVITLSWLQPDSESWRHLAETRLWPTIFQSVSLLFGAALGTLFFGVTLAALTTFIQFPGRRFLNWALVLGFAAPTYVVTFAWVDLFDFSGPVASYLRSAGLPATPEIRSLFGAIVIFSLSLFPYVYLLAKDAFLSQGGRAWEASRSLGRSPIGTFATVLLPLSKPWILAGLLMVAMETLADFGAVSLLGVGTFSVTIYRTWHSLQAPLAAAQMASMLVIVAILFIWLQSKTTSRRKYFALGGQSGAVPIWSPGLGWRLAAAAFAWIVFLVAVVMPLARLAWQASGAARRDIAFKGLVEAFTNSLVIGAGAAVITTLLGFALVSSQRLYPGRVSRWASQLSSLGYALPGAVLAVGVFLPLIWVDRLIQDLMAGWGYPVGLLITGSVGAMLFGYSVRFMALSHFSSASAMERVAPSLEDAARSLGANETGVIRRVHLPLLRKALLVSSLIVLVDVMKEMPLTLMTRPYGWDTLSVRIYQLTQEGLWDLAAIPALALVAAGLLPTAFLVLKLKETRSSHE